MQPDKLDEDCMVTINKTITSVLEGKHLSKRIPSCAKLETYEGTPIFIPVTHKISERSGPRGMDSEALQGRILKFGEDSTRLRTIVETFVGWLANGSPPWESYRSFMSGRLITLDKQPGIRPVGVVETWRHIFEKIVIKVTVLESTMACQDDQLCAGLKVVIDGAIHRVQALWDKNSSTE